ncbi:hypothetical protein [Peredibacter starrii]|uniref:Uncharacterized protein n=1 Tax=Peredibacter starrii TaxID=28202 RepID=A0AAX4HUV5_9BACT|nr:hypothetical protein [Peredibacter starrii]WPU66729.1 hypothetical protein SOO65_08215 [Peredibacter starrii]
MKKLIIAALALVASVAQAETVQILNVNLPMSRSFSTRAFTRFYMDTQTGEGFAKVTATEERYTDMGGGHYGPGGVYFPRAPQTFPVVIFEDTIKIDNLMLMDGQIIYHGENGDVNCGKMGVSRVFKRPTIFLSGKCDLDADLRGTNLKVNFITK